MKIKNYLSKLSILLVVTIVTLSNAFSASPVPSSVDATFTGITSGASEQIRSIVKYNGKYLIAGDFDTYNGNNSTGIALISSTGVFDNTFTSGLSAGENVEALAVQSDNTIVVSTSTGGVAPFNIKRLNSSGQVLTTTTVDDLVLALGIQSGTDKIIVGGYFTKINGNTVTSFINRLTSVGAHDATFNPMTVQNAISCITVTSTNEIYIGGYEIGSTNVAKLNADGSQNNSFSGQAFSSGAYISSIVVKSNGKLVVGGNFTTYNSNTVSHIVGITSTGAYDNTFATSGTGFSSDINALAIQSDDKILVGGNFQNYNGTTRNYIARINSNGTLDASFTSSEAADALVNTICIDGDYTLIGGNFTQYNSNTNLIRLAKLHRVTVPAIITSSVTNVTTTTATGGGEVTNDGGYDLSAKGTVWNTSINPTTTTNLGKIVDGSTAIGTFTANLTSLQQGVMYYVRAYATNQVGTAYGDNVTFTTVPTLGQWGLIAFGVLMASFGGVWLWKKNLV